MPEISFCGKTEAELTGSAVPYEVGMSRYRELARGAVVGDVVTAGSAVRATARALGAAGATTVGIGALLVLGETGRTWATDTGLPITSLAEWANLLHEPASCPLCAAGEPLETPD